KLDADGDGRIAEAEASTIFGQAFSACDEDGDGYVSREEYERKARDRNRCEDGGKLFQRADSNGDGVLTLAEHRAAALEQFVMLDADGDDAIARQELVKHASKREAQKAKPEGRAYDDEATRETKEKSSEGAEGSVMLRDDEGAEDEPRKQKPSDEGARTEEGTEREPSKAKPG